VSVTTTTQATTTTTSGPLTGDLNGAGATFPQPAYVEWTAAFQQANPGVKVNYEGVGSTQGIARLTQMTVDFAGSDVPMTDVELAAAERASGAKVLSIPSVLGAVVLAYNLPGVGTLKLDADTLAAIFLGHVSRWDDPMIGALNPDLTLPSGSITVVHCRSSTLINLVFTSYLSLVSAEWRSSVGAGRTVDWPTGIGEIQGSGVSPFGVIVQTPGSIGYVELSYALANQISVADLKNKSGAFVTPTADSAAAAGQGVQLPTDLRFSLLDSPTPRAYPIAYGTQILVYAQMKDPPKAALLKAFLRWALSPAGNAVAAGLDYAPLSADLKVAALRLVDSIGPQ
jgi:phosphate transport system substrate-binding protein